MNGADYYGCALPAMVREWRRRLPGGDDLVTDTSLPFVIVELAAYCNEQDENTFRTFCDANTSRLTAPDFHLPELRLAQARVLEVPHAFLESAMDLGSLHPLPYESIHPTNKQEVARRVSLALRYALYGDTTLVYRGPVPTGAVFEDASGHVTVSFDVQAGAQGLSLDAKAGCPEVVLDVYCRRKQLAGFEIQVGGEWQAPLSAALVPSDGGDVVLGAVDRPQRVRYAYSDWPVVSLRNKEGGLPARLFDIEVH
jgi:sialate O-acetylesterase